MPGAMFAPPFTWERMKRHVERVLECWGGRPFILGTADQVPPDGDISFCRKIANMLRGRRPATLPPSNPLRGDSRTGLAMVA